MKQLVLALAFASLSLAQSSGVGSIWTVVSGTLQNAAVANGNGTALAIRGLSVTVLTVNCSSCSGGTTVNFEVSEDGTNFVSSKATQVGTDTIATSTTASGITVWHSQVGGMQSVRARISAYSAGTVTVTATATAADFNPKTVNANAMLAGTAADGNSGNKSAQTMRVVLATDQPQLTNKLLVTPDSVALPANQSVNAAQINGVTPLMGNGTTGTGSPRVTIASDNTAFPVNATLSAETTKVIGTARVVGNGGAVFDAAGQNAASPANELLIGGQFNTTPTTITSGNMSPLQLGSTGHLLVTPDANAAVNATLSAETTKVIGTARIQGNVGGVLDVVADATAPANILNVGGRFVTTPATLTTGQAGSLQLTAAQNLKSDMTTVAGTATGTAAAGVQKVGVVGNAGAAFDAATGAAPPANGVLVAGLTSGATAGFLTAIPVCDSTFNINISTATTTLAVTGVSGRHVRICAIDMITAAANNVGIISGTGATCGTGSGAIVGTTAATGYNFPANGGIAIGTGIGMIKRTVATGDSVCIITSAATQLSGTIAYAIY
jgi:hypothetical protein